MNAHLRPAKPLRLEERVGWCENGIREPDRRNGEAESRWMGAGGGVVSLSQWWMGARVSAG